MSLTHKDVRRVELPHEPGSWIEVRMPSLGIIGRAYGLDDTETGWAFADMLLKDCIKAWSYDEPVTPENIEELDAETGNFLVGVLMKRRDEKNS